MEIEGKGEGDEKRESSYLVNKWAFSTSPAVEMAEQVAISPVPSMTELETTWVWIWAQVVWLKLTWIVKSQHMQAAFAVLDTWSMQQYCTVIPVAICVTLRMRSQRKEKLRDLPVSLVYNHRNLDSNLAILDPEHSPHSPTSPRMHPSPLPANKGFLLIY